MVNIDINVRKMTDDDLPSVMEIENLCFIAPWHIEDFHYELHENPVSNLWVLELGNTQNQEKAVVGFSDYWNTFDSGTICQIAIHPTLQRRQLGSVLMDEIYNDCYAKKIRTLCLEVRKSNVKAQLFYKKHGFSTVLCKNNYYSNGEDALYMTLEVK